MYNFPGLQGHYFSRQRWVLFPVFWQGKPYVALSDVGKCFFIALSFFLSFLLMYWFSHKKYDLFISDLKFKAIIDFLEYLNIWWEKLLGI